MSRSAFVEMVKAYRETIGQAYPKRDPIAVFSVLGECAAPVDTTQVAIAAATGIKTAEVNKIISEALAKGWVHREDTRTCSGAKPLSITEAGWSVLSSFDQRCEDLCKAAVSGLGQSRSTGKQVKSTARKRWKRQVATAADYDALFGNQGKG